MPRCPVQPQTGTGGAGGWRGSENSHCITGWLWAVATLVLVAYAKPAAAQITSQPSLLPATGTNVQLGDGFQTFRRAFAPSTPPAAAPGTPSLVVTPSIGLQEEYTDNALTSVGGQKRGDFITTLTPGLMISNDSQRLKANLSYSPSIYIYSRDSSQDQVGQNFSGTALATVISDLFYVDLRGYASEQATGGGLDQNNAATLNRQNTSQNYSFSISPYLVHRFGGYGTGELGYAFGRTLQNAEGTVTFPLTSPLINENVTTQNEHLGFKSGENFGRFNNATLLSATQYTGSGVLSGAHRNILTLDNGYAVTRNIIVLAKVGYEDIHYGGTSQVNIRDEIWSAGARLTPNQDSSITVRYGHQDGLNSLFVDAAYAPTARTRIFARYSSGLTTGAEDLQNALATSSVDASGNTVDSRSGAPLLLASNFFGVQNNLYKQRELSLTGVLQYSRDVLSATVSNEDQTLVSASVSSQVGVGSNNGTYGTISWTRAINPHLSSSVFFQYGTRSFQSPLQTEEKLLASGASLRYVFTDTLFGTAQYIYNKTVENLTLGNLTQNIILINLQKTF